MSYASPPGRGAPRGARTVRPNRDAVNRQLMRSLIVTVLALALVIPVLLAGGVIVRGYVRTSFHQEEEARAVRALAFTSLRLQLDEEKARHRVEGPRCRAQ